jgi:hypothetical protein
VAKLRARLPAPQRRVVARALASVKRGLFYKPLARRYRARASVAKHAPEVKNQ